MALDIDFASHHAGKKDAKLPPVIIPVKDFDKADLSVIWQMNGGKHEFAVAEFNSGKQLSGRYVAYDKEGKIAESGLYKNGRKTGKWTKFSAKTGNPLEEYEYSNNKYDGSYTRYSDAGKIIETGFYKEGKRTGMRTEYEESFTFFTEVRNENGTEVSESVMYPVKAETEYLNDKKHGSFVKTVKGKTYICGRYDNGNKVGEWTEYYKGTDNIHERRVYIGNSESIYCQENFYRNGKPEATWSVHGEDLIGTYVQFFENGNRRTYSEYDNSGKRQGTEYYYFENTGNILCTFQYKDGKRHGTEKEFYENGVLKTVRNFRENELCGPETEYDDKGNVKKAVYYKDSKPEILPSISLRMNIRMQKFRNTARSLVGMPKKKIVVPEFKPL